MIPQTFTFGKNWQSYIKKYLNPDRIADSRKSLINFYGRKSFKGKTFLDIGCGSGLFSLAAYQLGATKIVSFDIDSDSVNCCRHLRQLVGKPKFWQVLTGSILDQKLVKSIGTFDYVYAWGVLHHTGQMWQALKNTCQLTKEGGLLYLAIYNKATDWRFYTDGRFGPSSFWLKVKKWYSGSSAVVQSLVDITVISFLVLGYLLTGQNPRKKIQDHTKLRGMSWHTDIRDWLGGYPYEYATVTEIRRFVEKRNFSLVKFKNNYSLKNNEYLFQALPS